MALAEIQDVQARLGRDLTSEEVARVPGLLDEASALVEAHLGTTYPDGVEVPSAVRLVVSRMVARVLTQGLDVPVGLESRQVSSGSFQKSDRFSSDTVLGGPWLAKVDKDMLAPYARRSFMGVRLGTDHR